MSWLDHSFKGRKTFSLGEISTSPEPEINLIPFIDVLLVVLIFLMISTTFTRYQELAITLPSANGSEAQVESKQIHIAVSRDGRFSINGKVTDTANAQDTTSSFYVIDRAFSDTANAQDTTAGIITLNAFVSEQTQILDTYNGQSLIGVSFTDTVNVADSITYAVPSFYICNIFEGINLQDIIIGAYLWNPVDDSQTTSWQNVDDNQSNFWFNVDDSQTLTWQNINDSQTNTWSDVDDAQLPTWTDVPKSS